MYNILSDFILRLIFLVPAALISLTVHEFAHAFVSYKLGDPTAKQMGRYTLNPFSHIDLLGFLSLILFRFGWAKPVPINPMYYKNRKLGVISVSIAGPFSNFLLAFLVSILIKYLKVNNIIIFNMPNELFVMFLNYLVMLNLVLAVFNLIPIPPLDGSKILMSVLPPKQAYFIGQLEQYSMLFIILLMFTGVLSGFIGSSVSILSEIINNLVEILPIKGEKIWTSFL